MSVSSDIQTLRSLHANTDVLSGGEERRLEIRLCSWAKYCEVMCQTREGVFHLISKHCEVVHQTREVSSDHIQLQRCDVSNTRWSV